METTHPDDDRYLRQAENSTEYQGIHGGMRHQARSRWGIQDNGSHGAEVLIPLNDSIPLANLFQND